VAVVVDSVVQPAVAVASAIDVASPDTSQGCAPRAVTRLDSLAAAVATVVVVAPAAVAVHATTAVVSAISRVIALRAAVVAAVVTLADTAVAVVVLLANTLVAVPRESALTAVRKATFPESALRSRAEHVTSVDSLAISRPTAPAVVRLRPLKREETAI